MKRIDLIADMKKFVGGGGFVTRKQTAEYMGLKDPHSVDKHLNGLERVNGKYYFIPDVVDQLLDNQKR